MNVDHTTYLVHDPAAKRTLLMKPKKRIPATKNDSKFRINSATTRRTLNAISTANDESRMMNFIQNENYEINSFRSNEKGMQPGNSQSVEMIRESWRKEHSKQFINSKPELSSSMADGLSQEKLNTETIP
jgi:hypothetical protein